MSSADLQTVIIACPNCGTRYQVPYGTIGAAGREVQCAQCSKPWHATADLPAPPAPPPAPVLVPPEPDRLFSPSEEAELDLAFEAEAGAAAPPGPPRSADHERTLAEIKAAIAPKSKPQSPIDPALLKRTRQAFERRQANLKTKLPAAQLRRTARIAALVILAAMVGLGYVMRTDIVRWYPSLAGLYGAIGMPVNVVGLEFRDTKTVTSFRDGKLVMMISSRIVSATSGVAKVPPVLITLLRADGGTAYEWTVVPRAGELAPGESFDFSTEVQAPPEGASRVRLSFANARGTAASTGTN